MNSIGGTGNVNKKPDSSGIDYFDDFANDELLAASEAEATIRPAEPDLGKPGGPNQNVTPKIDLAKTTVRLGRQRKVIDYNRMNKGLDFSEKHEKKQKSDLTSRKKKISIPKPTATPKMSEKNGGVTTTSAGTSSAMGINDMDTDDMGAGNVGASTMGADATGTNATER